MQVDQLLAFDTQSLLRFALLRSSFGLGKEAFGAMETGVQLLKAETWPRARLAPRSTLRKLRVSLRGSQATLSAPPLRGYTESFAKFLSRYVSLSTFLATLVTLIFGKIHWSVA